MTYWLSNLTVRGGLYRLRNRWRVYRVTSFLITSQPKRIFHTPRSFPRILLSCQMYHHEKIPVLHQGSFVATNT